jgi:hypothetical protein
LHGEVTHLFVKECCRVGAGYRVAGRELYAAYRRWCEAGGHRPKSYTLAAEDWRRLGFVKRSLGGKPYWYGVDLKNR